MKISLSDYNYLVRMINRGEDIEKILYAFKENDDYDEQELKNKIMEIEKKLVI